MLVRVTVDIEPRHPFSLGQLPQYQAAHALYYRFVLECIYTTVFESSSIYNQIKIHILIYSLQFIPAEVEYTTPPL